MVEKVRIISGRWWYENKVGEVFDVFSVNENYVDESLEGASRSYEVDDGFGEPAYILAEDCVTVDQFDVVEKPAHYNSGKFEVIDVIEDSLRDIEGGFEAYCIGNVTKYIARYRHKNGVEDLRKAGWYLNRVIEAKGE